MESARIVVNGWREGKKMAQMTSIESDTAREFHGRTRHGVLSIECALRNQVSLALWIRNGQGHVPTQQQQQLLRYYDGSSVFSPVSINKRERREPANNAGSPSAAAPARFLNLETHAPSTYYSSFFFFPDVKERISGETTTSDWFKLLIRTEYKFSFQ
jgi:hypothetical protein